MAGEEDKNYMFGRDFRASIRLNVGHWIMKELTGYLLHPAIKIGEDARIADVATGTAIWLQELARKLPPTTSLDGFDSVDSQYPPRQWLPGNVHLAVQDAFQPFPNDRLGQYDVVHVRFLCTVVNNTNAKTLVKNLASLLKPGGYLQWYEPQPLQTAVINPNPSVPTPTLERMAKRNMRLRPDSEYEWSDEMAKIMEEQAGLQTVAADVVRINQAEILPWMQACLSSFDEMKAHIGPDREQEMENEREGMLREIATGAYMDFPWMCAVGRKPLNV